MDNEDLKFRLETKGNFQVVAHYVCPDCGKPGQIEITDSPANQDVLCPCGRILFNTGTLGITIKQLPELGRDALKDLLK